MAFLVTEEVLESLLCNNCHKFLSVKPIKVYPNRKIKCGRCSEDGDDGVVSLYNLLADQCLFKCVNRFDGCKKLLNFSDVPKHELECVSKSYLCPICPVSTMVPTYLMVSHFTKEHENMFLDTPLFFIDLTVSEIMKFFLYRHQDRLFIVVFKTNAFTEYITLSSMLLGDPEDARNISQKFTLCTGTVFEIHSREESCNIFDLSNVGRLKVEKSEISNYRGSVNVTFKMHIINTAGLINLKRKCNLRIEITPKVKKYCFKRSRNIFLDTDFRKSYPEFSIASNFTSLIKIDENKIKSFIVLSCLNCSLLDYVLISPEDKNVYTVRKGQIYFLMCYNCPEILYKKKIDEESCSIIGKEAFEKILFFCIWQCGTYFDKDSLEDHEIECPVQPFRKCPVNDCIYENTLFGIKKHIEYYHSRDYSVFFQYEVPNDLLKLSLEIETSPIKQIIIVANKFILMESVWTEPLWNITISHICRHNPSGKCDKFIAVALISDDKENLLRVLKENETASIYHREILEIKFYFKLLNKD